MGTHLSKIIAFVFVYFVSASLYANPNESPVQEGQKPKKQERTKQKPAISVDMIDLKEGQTTEEATEVENVEVGEEESSISQYNYLFYLFYKSKYGEEDE